MTHLSLTIRFAHSYDAAALAALAQLDSAEPLVLPALVAEVDGGLRAALSFADSTVIADPFHPTSGLVDLLRIRARQLTAEPRPKRVRLLVCRPVSKLIARWRPTRRTPARSA